MEGIEFELSFGRTMTTILKVAAGIDNLGTKAVGLLAQFQKPVNWAELGKTQMQLNDFAENMQRSTQAVLGFMQPGIDFEQKMAELQAGTGVTDKELAKIAKSTRALAVEMGIGASETGQVYLDMLSKLTPELAKTEEGQAALNSMVKTTALLSKGMGGDVKGAGDALTTMMNAMNVDVSKPEEAAKKMQAIGDMITQSYKGGSVDVAEMAKSMKTLGATGAMTNVSLAEQFALLQVVGQRGAKEGAEGGIALRNAFMKMDQGDLMPPKTLALLKAAKVNVGLLTDTSKTAAQRLSALKTVTNDKGLMGELAGAENVVALQALVGNLGMVETKTKEIQNSNGEMGKFAKVTMNTTQEAINRLKAGFTELSLTTYDSLKPYVPMISLTSQMAQGVSAVLPLFSFMGTMLTSGVGALFRYVFGLTATTTANVVTAGSVATTTTAIEFQNKSLAGAGLGLLKWAGRMVVSGVGALGTFLTSIGLTTAGTWLFNASLSANPIGLVVIGVVALGAVLYGLYKYFDGFGNMFRWLWDVFKEWNVFSMIAKSIDYVFGGYSMGKIRDFFSFVEEKAMWLYDKIRGIGVSMGWLDNVVSKDVTQERKNGKNNLVGKNQIDFRGNLLEKKGLYSEAELKKYGVDTKGIDPSKIADIFGAGASPTIDHNLDADKKGKVAKGLEGVAGSGSKATNIAIVVSKLLDKVEIHTATLKEGTEDAKKQMIELWLSVLNGTNQYQA